MTCWDALPFEMKLEVFKYLNKKERWKFAKCSFECLTDISRKETCIESLDVEGVHSAEGNGTIFIIKIDHSFVVTFKQIGNLCEIEHHGEFIYRTIGDSENMAWIIFANVIINSKNNLWNLRFCRVPFYPLHPYPRLNTLDITTSDKHQLYACIFNEMNLVKNLYVNLERSNNQANNKLSKWSSMKLWVSKMLGFSTFTEEKEEVCYVDYELMYVFEKLDVLRINLRMRDDQFIELTKRVESIECDARNIEPSTIAEIVLEAIRSHDRLKLSLKNVDVGILDFLNLFPRDVLIYRSVPYDYGSQHEFFYCLYNSSTGDFCFNAQGFSGL